MKLKEKLSIEYYEHAPEYGDDFLADTKAYIAGFETARALAATMFGCRIWQYPDELKNSLKLTEKNIRELGEEEL